jgi:hypothetical protein
MSTIRPQHICSKHLSPSKRKLLYEWRVRWSRPGWSLLTNPKSRRLARRCDAVRLARFLEESGAEVTLEARGFVIATRWNPMRWRRERMGKGSRQWHYA